MRREQLQAIAMLLFVVVTLAAVMMLYRTLQRHHPRDLQNDPMMKTGPAPGLPVGP
jgi:hypothetical protein